MQIKFREAHHIPGAVKIWLLAGLVMIFLQVVIGGVTRLTGSGLSITKWEVVRGTIPPLSAADWDREFALYKQTPQYQKINQGMSLNEFKFIYFWEYFHRFWARLMFFVFVVPFAWFVYRGMLSRTLYRRLWVVVLLAGLEGFFGWIMVKSGLRDRPWVNAYNLTLHLGMALLIFGYLFWTFLLAVQPSRQRFEDTGSRRLGVLLLAVGVVQIVLGALMSGTKAGLLYPTWPDMNGGFMPALLLDAANWHWSNFLDYDRNPFMSALIQFLHRNVAYVFTFLFLYFFWHTRRHTSRSLALGKWLTAGLVFVQVLLGILTLVHCKGEIPVGLGALHQAGAFILFLSLLYLNYQMFGRTETEAVSE